jgi:hypothetical protein
MNDAVQDQAAVLEPEEAAQPRDAEAVDAPHEGGDEEGGKEEEDDEE